MDSISHSATATTSVADENSKIMVPSKRDLFLSTYQPHQPWALPDSIIYYISINPSSTKVYKKLIQSCKYFFIKNSILVIPRFHLKCDKNEWKILFNRKEIDLKSINCKIWISDNIYCRYNDGQYFVTSLIPKIFQCDAKIISLRYQNISFNDLVFLASKCEIIRLFNVTVLDGNGSGVPVEKFVETFPVVKGFAIDSDNITATKVITSNTVQNLLIIPHFGHLHTFKLVNIPECFDIDTFYAYIKKNKKIQCWLEFCENISEQYRIRLQIIVNEIIQAKIHFYRPPYIFFPGMAASSRNKLFNLSIGF